METRPVIPPANCKPVLIIGYGNTLRGDDGVGPEVARILAECDPRFVETHQATQLMPELAEQVANARAVIFIDAKSTSGGETVSFELLEPAAVSTNPAHSISPPDILRLAIDCYGHAAPSWLLGIRGCNFGFCNTLSERAQLNVATAVQLVREHVARLRSYGCDSVSADRSPTCEAG